MADTQRPALVSIFMWFWDSLRGLGITWGGLYPSGTGEEQQLKGLSFLVTQL